MNFSTRRVLRLAQNRTFVSSLFGFTFFATVVTVSASNILPCPARPTRERFNDADGTTTNSSLPVVVVAGKRRKWIEEQYPVQETCQRDLKQL